jgi:hypothetical protein
MDNQFMKSEIDSAPPSTKIIWIGRILSALPVLILLLSGVGKLVGPEPVKKTFTDLGWNPGHALGLGILELA